MPAPGKLYVSSIHLADAAAAVVAALGVAPGIYNVVDDEAVTGRHYAAAIEAAVGRPAWMRDPGSLMKASPTAATAVSRSHRVSNAKLRAASGWAPRYPSVREGYAAEAAHSAK
jgi:nucleoside-diphosphate-sugar epimerase